MKGLRYLISLQDKVSNVADRIGGKVRNLVGKLDGLTSVQDKVNTSSGKAARGLDGMSGSLSRFVKVGTLAAGISIAGQIGAIGQQAVGVAKNLVDSTLEFSRVDRVVKFTGANEGAKNLAFLDATITKFNLPIREARNSFADMSGSFMGTSLAGQGLRDVFEGMSAASAVLGLSNDRVKGSFYALSQMATKPTLMLEELKTQLSDHLPGAMTMAARSMNMPLDKFLQMVEDGKVLSTDFLPKFAAELKRTFGEEAVRAAQLPQGQLTALDNKFQLLKKNLGEKLLPVVLKIGIVLMQAIDKIMPYVDIVATFIRDRFARLTEIFTPLATSLNQAILPFQNLISAIWGFAQLIVKIADDIVVMIFGAVDWGNLLSRVFTIAGSVIGSLTKILSVVWSILSQIVGLVIKLAGWIIEKLGGLGLRVLEGVAWAFGKIAQGVEWAYNKIVALLEAVGLLDKKSVSVKVQEKVERIGGANSVPTTLGGLNTAGGATAGAGAAGSAPAGSKESANKINEGGSRPVNISIKYDAMIKGGINIHTTNMKEGVKDLERLIEETILRSLNGATQMVR